MPKIICPWCRCQHNNSEIVEVSGECLFEGTINLIGGSIDPEDLGEYDISIDTIYDRDHDEFLYCPEYNSKGKKLFPKLKEGPMNRSDVK